MSDKRIIDYYAILNLPPYANFDGVENAYTRLSGELVGLSSEDETAPLALERLNEAYAVLSHSERRRAEQRREYDQIYFSREIADIRGQDSARRRRQTIASTILTSGLLCVVIAQSVLLATVARDDVVEAFRYVFGPLTA